MHAVKGVKHKPGEAETEANASCENGADEAKKPAKADTAPRENGSENGSPTLPLENMAVAICGARTPKGPCSKLPAQPKASRCAQHGGKSTGATLQGRLKISKLYRERDDEERLAEGHVVPSAHVVAELRRRHIYPVQVFVGCSRSQVTRARDGRPVFRFNALAFERAIRAVPPCAGCAEHNANDTAHMQRSNSPLPFIGKRQTASFSE